MLFSRTNDKHHQSLPRQGLSNTKPKTSQSPFLLHSPSQKELSKNGSDQGAETGHLRGEQISPSRCYGCDRPLTQPYKLKRKTHHMAPTLRESPNKSPAYYFPLECVRRQTRRQTEPWGKEREGLGSWEGLLTGPLASDVKIGVCLSDL